MPIQLNTDSNIKGDDALAQQVEAVVRNTLERFSGQITRVSIHLSDENSNKEFGAEDKRRLLEARLAGLQPVSVSHQAATLEPAVDGAVEKLKRCPRQHPRAVGQLLMGNTSVRRRRALTTLVPCPDREATAWPPNHALHRTLDSAGELGR